MSGYLLDMCTREISFVEHTPSGEWIQAKFYIMRLDNVHHDIEWNDVTIRGLLNLEENCIILQDRGSAFDIEYYTRGDGILKWDHDS
jgi:hypothetical protein